MGYWRDVLHMNLPMLSTSPLDPENPQAYAFKPNPGIGVIIDAMHHKDWRNPSYSAYAQMGHLSLGHLVDPCSLPRSGNSIKSGLLLCQKRVILCRANEA